MLVLCVLAATACSQQASAAVLGSSGVPKSLPASIMKLARDCVNARPSLGPGHCEAAPWKAKAVSNPSKMALVIRRAIPICENLRPNQSDGELRYIQIIWNDKKLDPRSIYEGIDFVCVWDGIYLQKPSVEIDIYLALPGKTLHLRDCSWAEKDEPLYSTNCFPTATGLVYSRSYRQSHDIMTSQFYASLQVSVGLVRRGEYDSDFNNKTVGDASILAELARVYGLSTGVSEG